MAGRGGDAVAPKTKTMPKQKFSTTATIELHIRAECSSQVGQANGHRISPAHRLTFQSALSTAGGQEWAGLGWAGLGPAGQANLGAGREAGCGVTELS